MAAMQPRPAWKTYLFVTLAMSPTLLAWFFWATYLTPKVHHWWDRIVVGSTAQEMAAVVLWMAAWSNRAYSLVYPILLLVVGILLFLELGLKKWWPRWRLTVLASMVILFHTLILLSLCMTSVVCTILVGHSQKQLKAVEAKMESATD